MVHLVLSPAACPTAASADSHAWHFSDGERTAVCRSSGGRHSIDLPGLARFQFTNASEEVRAAVCPGVSREQVEEVYRSHVLPFALQALGREVLHASANVTPAGVVAWCAATGVGKSTLAYGLSRHGFPVWSDDLVAWSGGVEPLAEPVPGPIRLRPASAAYFGPARADPPQFNRPARLGALCVLRRGAESDRAPALEIMRLTPARAFAALLAHAFCFNPDDKEGRRRLALSYLDLAARVPVWEITFQPGWDRFAAVLQRLAAALHAGELTALRE